MQYMYSVFIKYMYTSIKPFPNFLNMSGLNGVDICDVTLTSVRGAGGGGTLLRQYVIGCDGLKRLNLG